MVERCRKIAKVVVVDLDGTLIRSNSFKTYVKCGLHALVNNGSYMPALEVACSLLIRKAGVISHNNLREICSSRIGFGEDVLISMRNHLQKDYSEAVMSFIREKRAKGYEVLLATAALSDYVPAVWDGDYVASTIENGKIAVDCRGDKKKDMVIEKLNGLCPEIFLTDHIADLPLMRYVADNGGKCVLVNPSEKTSGFFREFEPSELLDVELLLDSGEAR